MKLKNIFVLYLFESKILKNVENGEIYEVTPLAKAMIGKKVGDSFRYEIDGYSHYGDILKIKKER